MPLIPLLGGRDRRISLSSRPEQLGLHRKSLPTPPKKGQKRKTKKKKQLLKCPIPYDALCRV